MIDWLTTLEAAGLAHELNNPASVVTRALDHLLAGLAALARRSSIRRWRLARVLYRAMPWKR